MVAEFFRGYAYMVRRYGVQAVLIMHAPFIVILAIGG